MTLVTLMSLVSLVSIVSELRFFFVLKVFVFKATDGVGNFHPRGARAEVSCLSTSRSKEIFFVKSKDHLAKKIVSAYFTLYYFGRIF